METGGKFIARRQDGKSVRKALLSERDGNVV